ncbi:MAG: hypothetical protein K2J82_02625 [Muribaculaceae bacterium]|nr:hypothetical protein [Muribaculaceae bacterium]MDE6753486.1 hypothetical protein [Muribaculaceae bacterium]
MKTNSKFTTTNSIESVINSIHRILTSTLDEAYIAVKDRKMKGASCKGMISVFRRSDLQEGDGKKATPIIKYAFYDSTYNPGCLGSIAIYGENLASLCSMIKKSRSLFGHRVIEVSMEQGRRPFIDVKFAA